MAIWLFTMPSTPDFAPCHVIGAVAPGSPVQLLMDANVIRKLRSIYCIRSSALNAQLLAGDAWGSFPTPSSPGRTRASLTEDTLPAHLSENFPKRLSRECEVPAPASETLGFSHPRRAPVIRATGGPGQWFGRRKTVTLRQPCPLGPHKPSLIACSSTTELHRVLWGQRERGGAAG